MSNEVNPQVGANGTDAQNAPQMTIQKVYIKDASFEAPGAPHVFQEQGQPRIELNLGQNAQQLGPNVYEIVLSVTVTCKLEDKTAYLAEVQQAGIFGLANFDNQLLDMVINTHCPHVLFPYARQAVSDLIQNGGFPPFLLQPISFEQIYAEQLRRRQQPAAA